LKIKKTVPVRPAGIHQDADVRGLKCSALMFVHVRIVWKELHYWEEEADDDGENTHTHAHAHTHTWNQ